MNKNQKLIIKKWLGAFFWLAILFGVLPFTRIDFTSTYRITEILIFVAFIYGVVALWALGLFFQTLARGQFREGITRKRKVLFILKRLYHIFFWPLAITIDAVKATYILFKRPSARL